TKGGGKYYSKIIAIDGWTNVSNKNIHNIICTTLSVFFLSVECDAAKQDSKYLMTLLEPVIADIGLEKVTSIVTDNEVKMKNLGFLVNMKHAHIFLTGCAAHTINLIAKDIARIDSIATLLKLSSKLPQILRKNGKIVKGATKAGCAETIQKRDFMELEAC
ncbi:zinc finger BED domain-containing protein 1-like protein, partial [Leptotrombidium deliense]